MGKLFKSLGSIKTKHIIKNAVVSHEIRTGPKFLRTMKIRILW